MKQIITQTMMALNYLNYLLYMPEVLDETDAPHELQIAPQNLLMVQAEKGPTEVEAPVNPRRTTRPHTRPQRLGQNIYDT